MKIIMKEWGGRDSHFGSPQVERLLSWLGGDTHALSIAEKLIAQNLPQGISVPQATAEQLGHATKAAMETYSEETEGIVRFVFSSLRVHEGAKCEAVLRSMISILPVKNVPKYIRIAVRARPSLAMTIAKTAAMLVPEEAEHIATAVESVVATAY